MKIIDIHTHIYPDDIALKATESIKQFYHLKGSYMDGTEQTLGARRRLAGIDTCVLLPVAIRPDRVHSINDFILHHANANPQYVPFGTVHAAMDGLSDEVERLLAAGVKGIKLHPDSQRFSISDERLYPMYEAVRGRLPVLIHMGDERYNYSHPIKLRRILDLFPGLDVIAAHLGGYSMYETARECLQDTHCVMDLSSSIRFMDPGIPEQYINLYGAERIAFGSDYPLFDPVEELERFLRLKLTEAQTEQILHKTAERILRLK